MAKPTRIALMGGWGYPATEMPWGMPALKARLEALPNVTVFLGSWKQRTEVAEFMRGFDGIRCYLGDSLGAGSAGQYPGDVKGPVDYAAGFQPSTYDARTITNAEGARVQILAANIARAHCVYDPYWFDTMGFGYASWQIAHGSTTRLLTTEHRNAHPDDSGYAQDLIFAELKGLIDAS